ncbi:D-galactoside-specific lectin [Hydra vulgaris]|uniref:D-galactoside-specific lectin n=1 Tax=Hydra vulgaris TaxID=6087 RepID=UPI0002B4CFA1|nr:D-galactoside-specific lectin-like [Hydra vulgaris]
MSKLGILFALFALTFALSYEVNEENSNNYENDFLDNLEDSEFNDYLETKDDNEDNDKEELENYEDNDHSQGYIKTKWLKRTARACEGNNLIINCYGQRKIKVIYANYGRTSSRICSGNFNTDLPKKCNNQKRSLKEVRSKCSGRSSCVVQASNGVFGDPCFGTYKYLEVRFYCQKKHHFIGI